MTDEGKTEVPEQPGQPMECMDRWKHHWQWIWEDQNGTRIWTDRLRCTTCGIEKHQDSK